MRDGFESIGKFRIFLPSVKIENKIARDTHMRRVRVANHVRREELGFVMYCKIRAALAENHVRVRVGAIVAETCAPFTVLPALMNEYRTPELNVRTGVLKSLSFMFEYIGEGAKEYIYAVTPLLQDALSDRDLVHRQTASSVVKHLSLGSVGLNREDALVHLLNFVWPNIFETSPHVINAVMEAIEGLRVALGPSIILQYVLQGLFHPARRVREIYWKIYNNLYIGSQDALIPAFPIFEEKIYKREELDMFL